MTTHQDNADPIELARVLGESIERIDELFSFRKAIRRIVIALALSIALTAILSIMFYLAIHNAQLAACRNANSARQEQVSLWNGIIHQFGQKHPSHKQIETNRRFVAFVGRIFHPANCSSLYRIWPWQ